MTLVLLAVLKVALIAFILGGVVALIVRGVRRSRANRLDSRWTDHRFQPGYEASVFGIVPKTPLPEWAYWDDDGDDERNERPR
ncbi:hypothetical protein [uncultured Mycobacterium sp.]|uniref:hypothetical protein n=1 Tax=uncultured Mycobacterium sp. TaxID=171292 RepID=UPI0035CA0399